jgi:glycosyltransferase involved in cell wall biosynthesis
MDIILLLTQSLESPSGLGRYWPLAKELACLGHRISLLALHHNLPELGQRNFVKDGVSVNYVGQMHVRKVGARKDYYGPGRLLLISLASTLSMARQLARSGAEVVHLCKPQPINSLAARLGRRRRPVYGDCDDYEAQTNRFSGEWQRRIVQHFEDGLATYAAGLTANTRFTLRRYQAMGVPEERMVYVPNGVDRERFHALGDLDPLRRRLGLAAEQPVVVYVGTLGLHSHPLDLLLQAFAKAVRKLPAARLLLVGGGEDYDRLQIMAEELGLAGRVIFAGRVPPPEVPAYYALGTVSVDPIHDDLIARARSPLKVLESLAVGVPVVTGDVGDRREILESGGGLLVPPGDVQSLSEGLATVLQDRDLRARLSLEALERREQYYWDVLVRDFVRIYGA